MMKSIFFAMALALAAAVPQTHAAVSATVDGWEYQAVTGDSLLGRLLGPNTKGVLVKLKSRPDDKSPTIRLLEINTDISKLGNDTKTWQSAVLVGMHSKPVIINERFITVDGQRRYVVEFQTDTGTNSMLQSTLMAFVLKGKLHLLLYENHQAIYRLDITDVRKALETVKLSVE